MTNLPKNSLRPLTPDERDFALGAIFPTMDIKEVPSEDFVVSPPLGIKLQGEDDLCSGYAVTAVSEDQEGKELLPEYQFFKTKQISGDPEEWGADLRDACKSATKFGSLSVEDFPNQKGITRSQLLISEQWPADADEMAKFYKKETYFKVTGKYDMFDDIRAALWQHRYDKCSIVTGALWRQEWTEAPDGVIPSTYSDDGFGHAFKIFGQKTIEGRMYLMAQLSGGTGVGDNGIFYFPREVVNTEIGKYGVFMFKDIPRETAELYIKNNQTFGGSFWQSIWSFITNLFKN